MIAFHTTGLITLVKDLRHSWDEATMLEAKKLSIDVLLVILYSSCSKKDFTEAIIKAEPFQLSEYYIFPEILIAKYTIFCEHV